MATVTIATRTKPNPNSKVGIAFARATDGRIMITRVFDSGLFSGSGLRPGQEIQSINGVTIRNKSIEIVLATLQSIERDITITAGPGLQMATLYCTLQPNVTNTRLHFNSQQASQVPYFLLYMGVPKYKWNRLVESFQTDLLPALQQSLSMDQVLESEMRGYTGKQMNKGYIGFGQESHHERKVFLMTHQAAVLYSSLTMVANNVCTKASALLNGHGVMAELDFVEKELPRYSTKQSGQKTIRIPTMIRFTPISDDGGSAISAIASDSTSTSAPMVNAEVVPMNDEGDC